MQQKVLEPMKISIFSTVYLSIFMGFIFVDRSCSTFVNYNSRCLINDRVRNTSLLLFNSPLVGIWKSSLFKIGYCPHSPLIKKRKKTKKEKKEHCLFGCYQGWKKGYCSKMGECTTWCRMGSGGSEGARYMFGERCVCKVLAGEGIWLPNALIQYGGGVYKPKLNENSKLNCLLCSEHHSVSKSKMDRTWVTTHLAFTWKHTHPHTHSHSNSLQRENKKYIE